MSRSLLEPAQQELDEAVSWYAAQAPGLGDAFLVEALRAFELIARHPETWHSVGEHSRRCRLARFPYGVIYPRDDGDGDGDEIIVLAIAHLHRKPDYWRDRSRRSAP